MVPMLPVSHLRTLVTAFLDSNFVEDVASTILRLHMQTRNGLRNCQNKDELRTGQLNSFRDALFDNEMNALVIEARKHYEETSYKLALKGRPLRLPQCPRRLQVRPSPCTYPAVRDIEVELTHLLRESTAAAGLKMHKDLIFKYMELQVRLDTPPFLPEHRRSRRVLSILTIHFTGLDHHPYRSSLC